MSETVAINGQNSVRTFEYNNQGLRTLTRVNGLVAVQGASIGAERTDCCVCRGVRLLRSTSRSVLECGSALPLSLCRGRSGPQGASVCTPSSTRSGKRRVRKPGRRGRAEALRLCVLCTLCGSNRRLLRGGGRGLLPQGTQRTQRSRRRWAAVAALSSVLRPLSSAACGLLARARHATTSPYAIGGLSYYHADGNGNVTYLAGSTGTADAAYKYDPFGRTLASTGSYAAANVYRFSSKPVLTPSGLYYYGYRFYDPNTQRWLNRDPIHEGGGFNLYEFAGHSPLNHVDALGESLAMCLADAGVNLAIGMIPVVGLLPVEVKPFQTLETALNKRKVRGSGPPRTVPSAIDQYGDSPADDMLGLAGKSVGEGGKRLSERRLAEFLDSQDRDAESVARQSYKDASGKRQKKLMDRYLTKLNPLVENVSKWSKAARWLPYLGDILGAASDTYQCFRDN